MLKSIDNIKQHLSMIESTIYHYESKSLYKRSSSVNFFKMSALLLLSFIIFSLSSMNLLTNGNEVLYNNRRDSNIKH